MTGSGSALVVYFQSKKSCEKANKQFRKNIKIAEYSIKNYIKSIFLCYTKLMMGRAKR